MKTGFHVAAILLWNCTIISLFGQTAPNGSDNIGGVSCPGGTFNYSPIVSVAGLNPYTGNCTRVVNDVSEVSISEVGLNFTRYYNTRGNPGRLELGNAGAWRHSFQWDFSVTTLNGSTTISLIYPNGTAVTFSPTSSTTWAAPEPITDTVALVGSSYILTTSKNIKYNFSQTTYLGQLGYYLTSIVDSKGLATTFSYSLPTYNQPYCNTTITEPGGRQMVISYAPVQLDSQDNFGGYYISSVHWSGGYMSYNYSSSKFNGSSDIYYTFSLSSVGYSDYVTQEENVGTSTYSYKTLVNPSNNSPYGVYALSSAQDGRANGIPYIKYSYFTGGSTPLGAVQSVTEGTSGSTICTLSLNGGNSQTPLVTDPDGSTMLYNVNSGNSGGLLASVTNSSSNTNKQITFSYSSGTNTRTLGTTDSNGHTISTTYSSLGKIISETFPPVGAESSGPTISWNYNAAGYVTSVVDASPTQGTQTTTTFTRAPNTNLVSGVAYADGSTEAFTYNAFNEVLTHTQQNGGVENFTYDSTGMKSTSQTAAQNATGNSSAHTTFTYNSESRLASIEDANGNTTQFIYNDAGQTTVITNPDNSTRSFNYNGKHKISETNELGKVTKYNYDGFNRLTSIVDPLSQSTTYAYDPNTPCNSRPIKVTSPNGKIVANAYAPVWTYELTSTTSGYGTSSATTISYAYDSVGNRTQVTDPRGNVTTISYDPRNRKDLVEDAQGNLTTYSYDDDSDVLTCTTPAGTTTNTYNSMDRLTISMDPYNKTSKYYYDPCGLLREYIDPNANIYIYTYDLDERQSTMVFPDHTSKTFSYDLAGNTQSYETRDSKTETFTYDNRNRPSGASWNDGVTPSTTFAFDSANRLTSIGNSNSALGYTFDDDNRVTAESENITGLGVKNVSYSYNHDGTLSGLIYPDSTSITYGYDSRDEVTSISNGSSQIVSYGYDLAGNRTTKGLSNGVNSAMAFDNLERVTSIADTTPSPTAGTQLQSFNYGYDTMSRLNFVQRNSGLGDVYAYDPNSQLTSVEYNATNPSSNPINPQRTVNYLLDASGNRTRVADSVNGATTYTINPNNQYLTAGSLSLSYDAKGNLTGYGGWTYVYDALNRIIQASNGTTVVNLAYDPIGRCVERTTNGTSSYFVYDQSWGLLAEYNSSGAQVYRYLHGVATDELLTRTDASNYSIFYHTDALGSITKLTDSTGALLEQYSYDVYGTPTIMNPFGNNLSGSAYNNRFMFTGREYLASLQLYDYRARIYSPSLGRYLQPDPLGHEGDGYNLQRYCGNNPVNQTDPSGLQTVAEVNGQSPDEVEEEDEGIDQLQYYAGDVLDEYNFGYESETSGFGPSPTASTQPMEAGEGFTPFPTYSDGAGSAVGESPGSQPASPSSPPEGAVGSAPAPVSQNGGVVGGGGGGGATGGTPSGGSPVGYQQGLSGGMSYRQAGVSSLTPVEERNDHSLPIPHTFLVFGNRGWGFWPKIAGWPEYPGKVKDDFYHPYTKSATRLFLVTHSQLSRLLSSIANNQNDWYDVTNEWGYNCTGWADTMLFDAGISSSDAGDMFSGIVENPWTH